MKNKVENLWPEDIAAPTEEYGRAFFILKEQAACLEEVTGGVVGARVSVYMYPETVQYTLYLTAACLGEHEEQLVTVTCDSAPDSDTITVFCPGHKDDDGLYHPNGEEEFVNTLRLIFSSVKTRRLIGHLVSMSKVAQNNEGVHS